MHIDTARVRDILEEKFDKDQTKILTQAFDTAFEDGFDSQLKILATKEDIAYIKAELKDKATKEDVAELKAELKDKATKEDVAELKAELKDKATKEDVAELKEKATKEDIANLKIELSEKIMEGNAVLLEKILDNKAETMKWMFIFWIGQTAVLGGLIFTMLKLFFGQI